MVSRQVYREVEGLHLSQFYSDQNIRAALAYEPRPHDIFAVSYPKCGITWLQYLVFSIFSGGIPPQSAEEFCSRTPFLAVTDIERIRRMPRPGSIRTHFPFQSQPYSRQAKYLYIARNPYDCCVSCYHHTRALPVYLFEDGTFDEFLEMFVEGDVECGDYFDHLLSWYEHRHDHNVLFLTYEALQKDTESCVLKIADFLGGKYSERLRRDRRLVSRISTMSNVEIMRRMFSRIFEMAFEGPLLTRRGSQDVDSVTQPITGQWRSHFSPKQVEKMKMWIRLKTAGSDVMQLWTDDDVP
ncbi:sulfotransferase ssu-1 [Ixodes scapularis]|uniref:sulfotransferase ssu-1 n=1 Tax=Ixodes scapularis TaxID=6945 RepID=UPI001A9EC62E|nr:sulfotransferase ssu-1 [Ixodes scapularis]